MSLRFVPPKAKLFRVHEDHFRVHANDPASVDARRTFCAIKKFNARKSDVNRNGANGTIVECYLSDNDWPRWRCDKRRMRATAS